MPRRNDPPPAEVLVVGTNAFRVDVLVNALKGDGFCVVGAVRFTGMRTALLEFPSVKVVVLLYADDVMAPFECVVLRVDEAAVTNYYALADKVGWVCGGTPANEDDENAVILPAA